MARLHRHTEVGSPHTPRGSRKRSSTSPWRGHVSAVPAAHADTTRPSDRRPQTPACSEKGCRRMAQEAWKMIKRPGCASHATLHNECTSDAQELVQLKRRWPEAPAGRRMSPSSDNCANTSPNASLALHASCKCPRARVKRQDFAL